MGNRLYTFNVVVNEAWTSSTYTFFDSSQAGWTQAEPTDSSAFSAIIGTGIAGSLSAPNRPNFGLFFTSNFMQVFALSSGESVGVTTPDGSQSVNFWASINLNTPVEFAFDPVVRSPASFLVGISGATGATGYLSLYNLSGYDLTSLAVSSVTFSELSAVPEPSTYAALLGVAALGVAAWRKRSRRSKKSGQGVFGVGSNA